MLPNLIIIGAMKCGTSALHQYLDQHPDIAMSKEKELDFFIEDRNWRKGLDWYRSMFPDSGVVRGEASPDYTHYPAIPGVPERMHTVVPGAKLIYMVRDPVERMLSQYMHNRWTGIETRLWKHPEFDAHYRHPRQPAPSASGLDRLVARLGAERIFVHSYPATTWREPERARYYFLTVFERSEG